MIYWIYAIEDTQFFYQYQLQSQLYKLFKKCKKQCLITWTTSNTGSTEKYLDSTDDQQQGQGSQRQYIIISFCLIWLITMSCVQSNDAISKISLINCALLVVMATAIKPSEFRLKYSTNVYARYKFCMHQSFLHSDDHCTLLACLKFPQGIFGKGETTSGIK